MEGEDYLPSWGLVPEGLSSVSESVIHFLSAANLSHPQEGARYTVPSKGPPR